MLPGTPGVAKKLLFLMIAAAVAAITLIYGGGSPIAEPIFMASAAASGLLAFSLLPPGKARHGARWKHLTLSSADLVAAGACVGMTVLFLYIFYVVGSARPDATSQMMGLRLLIVGFASLSAFAAWHTFARVTRWNDHSVEQDVLFFGRRTIHFRDIAFIGYETWSASYVIGARDGTRIKVLHMHGGVKELWQDLSAFLNHGGSGSGLAALDADSKDAA